MTLALLLGIILGMKHALEPDHVTSLLAMCANDKTIKSSVKISLCWGAGHTVMLGALAIVILISNVQVRQSFHEFFEILVGIILIFMGIKLIFKNKIPEIKFRRKQLKNKINDLNAQPIKALMLGLIHGCAGSGAVVLFTLNEFGTIEDGLFYILVFSISLVISISVIPLLIHLPVFRTSSKSPKTGVLNIVAMISIFYGSNIIYKSLL